MLKAKQKSKTKKKKNKKSPRLFWQLVGLLLIVTVLMAGAAVYFNNTRAAVSLEDAANSNYKSLNLALARRATYTNSPLQITKDNGTSDSIKHLIVRFKVPRDSLDEYAYMTLPAAKQANTTFPVIILCHGYSVPASYSTTRSYLSDMEFYSQHGYAVIKPDFRGQGLSRSQGLPEGAYFSMAYNTDLMSLIAAVKQTPYLNTSSLAVWGHSMGAYVALRAAVLSPDIKKIILLSLPGDIVENAKNSVVALSDRSNFVAAKIRAQQLSLHGEPIDNMNYWQQTSPINFLNSLKAQVQINFGTNDNLVSLADSTTLAASLTKLSKPNELFIYPGGGHGLVPERSLIWSRSLQLLKSGS
jgi:dipeptidyl aminopeptidase/acylaminoacyl peptidase